MGLQHGLALCFAQFSLMLWLESLVKMQLLHLRMSCLESLLTPFLQSSFQQELCHYGCHNVRFCLVEIVLHKHMCNWVEHSLALQLSYCIHILGSRHAWGVTLTCLSSDSR
jgi:hypothetical protein